MADGQDRAITISKEQYQALAAFRFELRRFLAFSEAAATKVGLPAQQHQALLAIAGHTGAATVGLVSERLLIAPHTAAELVARMMEASLVTKSVAPDDRRRVEVALTAKAEDLLQHLSSVHLEELGILEPALIKELGRLNRNRP